jgi:hypothetical protein
MTCVVVNIDQIFCLFRLPRVNYLSEPNRYIKWSTYAISLGFKLSLGGDTCQQLNKNTSYNFYYI